jgi:hypothetical protein
LFDIPKTCESGASALQVIVNGLASAGVNVTLQSTHHVVCQHIGNLVVCRVTG